MSSLSDIMSFAYKLLCALVLAGRCDKIRSRSFKLIYRYCPWVMCVGDAEYEHKPIHCSLSSLYGMWQCY
jgi:hypothetical protein